MVKKVAVIMGSDSDFDVVSAGIKQLKALDIPVEVHVMSAHRTPERASAFAAGAKEAGFGVIIAAAGMAAHLAGVLAANTTLPVIGIPIRSTACAAETATVSATGSAFPTSSAAQIMILRAINLISSPAYSIFAR